MQKTRFILLSRFWTKSILGYNVVFQRVRINDAGMSLIIEGLNKVKKHVKARRAGDPSGIVEAEAPMYASKVQIYCSACKKPTRVKHNIGSDGAKERICAKCGAKL